MSNTEQTGPAENPYPNGPTKGFLPGKMYDKLKWIALVFIPAFAAFYFAFGKIWDFPRTEDVVGSLTIIGTFLGTILGISSKAYNASDARFAGQLNVYNTVDEAGVVGKTFQIDMGNTDPWFLEQNKELTLKVNPPGDEVVSR